MNVFMYILKSVKKHLYLVIKLFVFKSSFLLVMCLRILSWRLIIDIWIDVRFLFLLFNLLTYYITYLEISWCYSGMEYWYFIQFLYLHLVEWLVKHVYENGRYPISICMFRKDELAFNTRKLQLIRTRSH